MFVRGHQAPLPFFEPRSDWTPPDLSSLPDWTGARRVAYDVETKDEDLKTMGPGVRRPGCHIVGYSFAIEDGPKHYIPLRHAGGGNVDLAQGLGYIRHQSKHFKGDICGAGLQYDLDFSEQEGIVFKSARFFRDVQIAAPLLNELENGYSLEAILTRAGHPGKDEALLKEALAAYGYQDSAGKSAKRGLWALPAKFVGPYGEQDSAAILPLLAQQERELEEQDLWRVWDLESRVLPILMRMRRRGVRVSLDKLEEVETWSRGRQAEALAAIFQNTGIRLDPTEVTKPEALARVLRSIGVEPPLTKKTGKPSVTDELVAQIKHPVGDAIRLARRMSRLRTTFCDSIRRHAIVDPYTHEARIHCTFNQLRKSKDEEGSDGEGDAEETEGAAYGRLSCTNPNLQQQPNPDRQPDYGKLWRSIYLPDVGKLWVTADYSQQEPRMAIHLAILAGPRNISRKAYEAALAAAQHFRDEPMSDFHDMMTRMVYGVDILAQVGKDKFKQLRNFCKQIFLGLSYGMGGAKLCRKLGLPTAFKEGKGGRIYEVAGEEGQAIIDKFNAEVPFVRSIAWFAQERAKIAGYIVCIDGRKCRFPRDEAGNYDWVHKAFNRLDQGSCAGQTKTALVALEDAGIECQLQVHDEIDWSANDNEEALRGAEIMETCFPGLHVTFRTDIEVGASWGEAVAI